MNETIRALLCDMGHEDAVVFDHPDYDGMVRCLMQQDNISMDEAIDFIEFNTIRALAYAGENAPIIMQSINSM